MLIPNENVTKRRNAAAALCTSLAACLLAWAPLTSVADEAFVDSVYEWGSWELGLEPAAGGPVAPKTTTVKVNQRQLQFRPNDNSAFRGNAAIAVTAGTSPTPPPVPVTPPTVGPLDGPPPTGSPADRF